MTEEEQQQKKPPVFDWKSMKDAFEDRGIGGSRDFVDSLRMASQAVRQSMEPLVPFEFPIKLVPAADPKSKQDLADAKIAELERRLQLEEMDKRRLERNLAVAREKVQRLERDNQNLAMEKFQGLWSPAAPEIIKKYLKFLIFACHPDRNPGRDEAVEVTKALLNLRGKK